MNFPEVINFRITSKCNNNCKYCYGPQNIRDLEFKGLKKIFSLFHKNGVKSIVLCGGEPLIRKDIKDIIIELKKHNFKIFLDTNGDFFFKYNNIIDKYINVLGLPLDFPSKSYRNPENLNNILKILNYYKEKINRPLIRIGTVVTKDNIGEIEKIAHLLKNYKIDIWKIYQFIPSGKNAIKNRKNLEIDTAIFEKKTNKIRQEYSKYFNIVISKRSHRTKAYFLINPDGSVFIPIDDLDSCQEIAIGHILDKNILNKWSKLINKVNYKNNIKVTYNYRF